jgi:predicted nucleic acid-binding protein
MKRFVLDTSVALSWFIDKPTVEYATDIRQRLEHGARALVPSLWRLEVANGFAMAERRGSISSSETSDFMLELDVIMRAIEVADEVASIRRLVAISRQFRLTAYDALYLELARDQQLPIATLDRPLQRAAREAGITIAH